MKYCLQWLMQVFKEPLILWPQVKWLQCEGSTHAWHLWLQLIKKASVVSSEWFITWSNVDLFFFPLSVGFLQNARGCAVCKAIDNSFMANEESVRWGHSSTTLFFPTIIWCVTWRWQITLVICIPWDYRRSNKMCFSSCSPICTSSVFIELISRGNVFYLNVK